MCGLATDGARSMSGTGIGFVGLFKSALKERNINDDIVIFHCIMVSKLLEHFILSNISPFLGTTDNQFGFKAGHSTDQCSILLKQTASYFVTHGYKVFKFCRCSSYEVMTI